MERGVVIDRSRGYVYVRFKRSGITRKELIGRTSAPGVIDRANARSQQLTAGLRAGVPGHDVRRERMLVEDAVDLFVKLHGENRHSIKGARQFVRHGEIIKAAWAGRFVDSISSDDLREFRRKRRAGLLPGFGPVAESTVNRQHTAIVTMFNRLSEWRRTGHIPRNVLLPEVNPGADVRKTSEDRFVRQRLLSDAEFERLWSCADERLRRIVLAEMNLPLRLADLRSLKKSNIHVQFSQFRGVQAKTGREYVLPMNEALKDLVGSARGETILDFTGFDRAWRQAVKRAGLQGLQFRDLRRTAATALHESGVALRTISAMLGHSAVTTTIRYLGLKEESLRAAGDVLAARYKALDEKAALQSVPESVPTRQIFEDDGSRDRVVL